ncbi:MAG: nucleotidyltransferase family protein, partial [Acidobacteriia bacterium]|nr:nucleotidyltransferase family protein [Terriglobia bacterium]
VLGHHGEESQSALNLEDVQVVINRDYRRGQTSSLQEGLKALVDADIEAVVFCLVDHPAVPAEVIRQLIAAFRESGAPVVIPTYEGRRGHPVVIGRALFEELSALGPGDAANAVIRKYRARTHFLPVGDRAILLDVDDPKTYRQLENAQR